MKKAPVLIDPLLPRGEIRPRPEPMGLPVERCSLRRPVCVAGSSAQRVGQGLEHLESAFEQVRFGLQRPLAVDPMRPLRWLLGKPGPGAGTLQVQPELIDMPRVGPARFDRGHAICLGGRPTLPVAMRCVHEASVIDRAPATASWLRQGFARQQTDHLARDPELPDIIATAQRHPGLGVGSPLGSVQREQLTKLEQQRLDNRSLLWFRYLVGLSDSPAAVDSGYYALTLGGTRTQAGALRFDGEPDSFDVLRASLDDERTELARFFDALSRARYVERDQQVEVDWEVTVDTLPRSLALPTEMLPTGSVYLLLRRGKVDWPERVAFRMYCEQPVSYVWSLLRLSSQGEELSHVLVAYKERGGTASQRIGGLEDAEAVLLVGTNAGGIDLGHPFDPDHGPHEAHRCTVAVDALPSGQ